MSPKYADWKAPDAKRDIAWTAAKFLHLRGYSGANLAEVEEAVRFELDEEDVDGFAMSANRLADVFPTKQQIFTQFLEGVLDEAVDHALEVVTKQLETPNPHANLVHSALEGGIGRVLSLFQSFQFLVAGAVAEAFTLRSIDTFPLAESRRIGHVFFAGLLGFWQLPGEEADEESEEWRERTYDSRRAPAVQAIRNQLDVPLGKNVMVEGLYLTYGAATLWWLMNRHRDPTDPVKAFTDLNALVAGALRQSGPNESLLRCALRIELRLRNIHIADPLKRLFPKKQFEGLGARLLSFAYGEVPRRIELANR